MSDRISSESVAQDQLRAFIERIERMEEEKKAIADDIKEIYAEAKGNGFDTVILRQIVKIRKMDPSERAEQQALLDLYLGALGMAVAPPQDDDYYDEPLHGSQSQPEHRADATGLRQIGSVASGIVANLNTNSAPAASNSDADAPVPSGAAKEVSPDASFAPIQPETATTFQVAPGDGLPVREPGANASEGVTAGETATSSLTGSAADKSASSGVSPALAAPTDPEALYAKAVALVREEGRASPSMLQRRLVVGFNRACDLVERMEREGIVERGPAGFLDVAKHSGPTLQPEASVH